MIGRTGNFGGVHGRYGSNPNSVASLYNQITGSREGYGEWAWSDLLPWNAGKAAAEWVRGDTPIDDIKKSVATIKVKDGAYTWLVYSNGDLKIYNAPAGQEASIGKRYSIGDTNYAKTLGVLRTRSKEVDKVLAKGGLDGAKLAQGATSSSAATAPQGGATGDDTTRTGGTGGGLQLKAGSIAGIAMGVVGLALILGLVFKRKRKGKK